MFKLHNNNKVWKVYKSRQEIKVGTFKEAVTYMVTNQGFNLKEIDRAVNSMIDNGDDTADFGINRTFIFSKNVNLKGVA